MADFFSLDKESFFGRKADVAAGCALCAAIVSEAGLRREGILKNDLTVSPIFAPPPSSQTRRMLLLLLRNRESNTKNCGDPELALHELTRCHGPHRASSSLVTSFHEPLVALPISRRQPQLHLQAARTSPCFDLLPLRVA